MLIDCQSVNQSQLTTDFTDRDGWENCGLVILIVLDRSLGLSVFIRAIRGLSD